MHFLVVFRAWNQFSLIAAAPAANGITSASGDFNTWVDTAVQNLTLAPAGLATAAGQAVTSQDILKALVQVESSSIHGFVLAPPLAFSNINVGEQISRDRSHYYTDDGIGFSQVQPYNSGGLNLYIPADNLTAAARIFAGLVNAAGNPGATAAEKVWRARYRYVTGNWGTGTIAQLRAAGGQVAISADNLCTDAGLDQVQ